MKKILESLDDTTPVGLIVLDDTQVIRHANKWLCNWFELQLENIKGQPITGVFPQLQHGGCDCTHIDGRADCPPTIPGSTDAGAMPGQIVLASAKGALECFLCVPYQNADDQPMHALLFHDPSDASAFHRSFVAVIQRLQQIQVDQHRLVSNLERANAHLMRSEKLAGIGQLAAGVAHEINNPIGYVFSNLKTLAGYMHDLLRIIDAVDQVDVLDDLRQLKNTLEYDYIRSDVEALINESEDGISRVKKIITALKDFSHMDEEGFRKVDLHRGFETTLNIINNELRHKATVIKQYSDLPMLECNSSQINQVFMNLMINATHAMNGPEPGTITVRTGHDEHWAWFEVEDDGCGMDEETLNRIFEPFFTTKPVGQGTGLGLSLSHSIVQKHAGHIAVFSNPGQGTRFRISLPIAHAHTSRLIGES
jgi:signal transduction histidine kinase